MSPRTMVFSRELVGQKGVELVRKQGWNALTARNIAARLGSSVAPVYSAFGSMKAMEEHVLAEALRLLDESISAPRASGQFLSMGIGLATFARNEPELFLSLYRTARTRTNLLGRFKSNLLGRLRSDPVMGRLSPGSLERVFERMWIFTIGLIMSLIYGHTEDETTEAITETLRNVGSVMLHAEFTGLADEQSESSRREWARVLDEWHLDGRESGGR